MSMVNRCTCCKTGIHRDQDMCRDCILAYETLSERYEIVQGHRGGMATVFKAKQKLLNRIVGIKVLHLEHIHDQEIVDQFIQEAMIAASLHHPNIVIIHDVVSANDLHFIVMEYVEGNTLKTLIHNKGKLAFKDMLHFLAPIARALNYIHQEGYVHRDVKSSNIIITHDGRPVLTDFGVALSSKGSISQDAIFGTPEYMSPEQAAGNAHLTGAADLYSLGAVLYECLTGTVPFRGATPHETIQRTIQENPREPILINNNVPIWLNELILDLLSKRPSERPQSGNTVAGHLSKADYQSKIKKDSDRTIRIKGGKKARPSKPSKSVPASSPKRQQPVALILTLILLVLAAMVGAVLVLYEQNQKTTAISGSTGTSGQDSGITAKRRQAVGGAQAAGLKLRTDSSKSTTDQTEVQQSDPEPPKAKQPEEPTEPEISQEEQQRQQAERRRKQQYDSHMATARQLVLEANFALAIAEYEKALANLPGDARARQGIRDAEDKQVETKRIANMKERFNEVIDDYDLVRISGGSFIMGTENGRVNQQPAHNVTLSPYYIARYEVSQALWQQVMGTNPSRFSDNPSKPVENVSWFDALRFLEKLSSRTGYTFRLPTEAEWEYAARSAPPSRYWYEATAKGSTHIVTSGSANGHGLYNMSGNVWEWCQDYYAEDYYANSSKKDPVGPENGGVRVVRGGSWMSLKNSCDIRYRKGISPSNKDLSTGFRFVVELPEYTP